MRALCPAVLQGSTKEEEEQQQQSELEVISRAMVDRQGIEASISKAAAASS